MSDLLTRIFCEVRTLRDVIRAFLNEHYAGERGHDWLGYIDGDPSNRADAH
jgi:hypothetical protein